MKWLYDSFDHVRIRNNQEAVHALRREIQAEYRRVFLDSIFVSDVRSRRSRPSGSPSHVSTRSRLTHWIRMPGTASSFLPGPLISPPHLLCALGRGAVAFWMAARFLMPCARLDRMLPTRPTPVSGGGIIPALRWSRSNGRASTRRPWLAASPPPVISSLCSRPISLTSRSLGERRASIRSTTRVRPSSASDTLTTSLAARRTLWLWWTSRRSAPGSIRLPRNCGKT